MTDELPPTLPADIIRMVIGITTHANHTIGEMRLVSHFWKDVVDEEFGRLSNLPPIDELEITPSADFFAGDGYLIMADLKIRNAVKFPLRYLYRFGFEDVDSMDDEEDNKENKMLILRKHLRFDEVLDGRTRALSSIKQIDRVTIKNISGHRIVHLPNIFRNIRTDEIYFEEQELITKYSDVVIKLVRQWCADRVKLVISDCLAARREFLLEMAELVDAMQIKQIYSYENSNYYRGTYLFDDTGLQIIYEMFGKRISKLRIEHNNHMIGANEDNLKPFLEMTSKYEGKKPWLEINAYTFIMGGGEFSMRMIKNDVILKVVPRGSTSPYFMESTVSLKHRSRVEETFE